MPSRRPLVLVTMALAAACGGVQEQRAGRPQVVATTSIVADLVRSIAGDRVELSQLMGPGIDPHLYKPSAGDVRRMATAQAVFYNGLHLEGKMTEVFPEMDRRGVITVAVAEAIPADRLLVAAGFGGVHDPHVWFDVSLWATAAESVRDALVRLDPVGRAVFEQRAAAYLAELAALDAWVRQRLATVPPPQRVLITAHDAFAYFGRAYGFEVRGLLGVSTSAEAGAGDVRRLAALIAERRIPAAFADSSVPPRYVKALQEAVAARGFALAIGGSLYSDALGNPQTPAGSYVGTVRLNVDTIVGALSESGGQQS